MSHKSLILAGALALLASPVLAQPARDAQTQEMIRQLAPGEGRGIRMPGADSGTPPPGATPPPAGMAPPPGVDTAPLPPTAALPVAPPATTAPAGVPAVSITVNFPTGSATLTPQAAAALNTLGQALSSRELAPYRFRIEGHTDTVGDDRTNMLLSQRRAEAVRSYLSKRYGVAPARLVAVGLGESQLLVPTPDQVPEPGNRRVQVLNLGG